MVGDGHPTKTSAAAIISQDSLWQCSSPPRAGKADYVDAQYSGTSDLGRFMTFGYYGDGLRCRERCGMVSTDADANTGMLCGKAILERLLASAEAVRPENR